MTQYDIKQVSKLTDISTDTVHHYVKKFRKFFKGLKRGRFNSLLFSDSDIELLIYIRTLNKVENMTLKEIKTKFSKEGTIDLNKESRYQVEEPVSETQVLVEKEESNVPTEDNVNKYALEKLDNFEVMISDIKDEYGKLVKNNECVLNQTEDLKKMMNLLYTKLNHIELRQQKIIDDVNVTFWDKLKSLLLKPVRVPFLWKL